MRGKRHIWLTFECDRSSRNEQLLRRTWMRMLRVGRGSPERDQGPFHLQKPVLQRVCHLLSVFCVHVWVVIYCNNKAVTLTYLSQWGLYVTNLTLPSVNFSRLSTLGAISRVGESDVWQKQETLQNNVLRTSPCSNKECSTRIWLIKVTPNLATNLSITIATSTRTPTNPNQSKPQTQTSKPGWQSVQHSSKLSSSLLPSSSSRKSSPAQIWTVKTANQFRN